MYCLFVEKEGGYRNPSIVHKDYEKAKTEAERLVRKEHSSVYLFEAIEQFVILANPVIKINLRNLLKGEKP